MYVFSFDLVYFLATNSFSINSFSLSSLESRVTPDNSD